MKSWIGLMVLAIQGCSCDPYSGDGTFTDRGGSAANNRYVLNLGRISLTEVAKHRFDFHGLPNERFIVGFDVRGEPIRDQPIGKTKPIDAIVEMTLMTDDGKLVIEENEHLRDWIWSYGEPDVAFIYRAGERRSGERSRKSRQPDHENDRGLLRR